ncbi:MAG: lipoyl synthase [Syntrophorhabdaceae bacterium]|nr:lipoyl synthase [Syntrophorhabdaceae bacterium]MDD5242842.1 lipoyl synthase [Syntrophorhabdaceae bacterium]
MMHRRLPSWFTQKIPEPAAMHDMEKLLRKKGLHTVCESALCPNMGQCFARRTATFMILGDTCTRRCTFCAVKKGMPVAPDEEEPQRICEATRALGLRYVVITSVTRDDLADGGASQFAQTLKALHEEDRDIGVEVLIPDFCGSVESLKTVILAGPQVINHNVETVPRLYNKVRPQAECARSVRLLSTVKELDPNIVTKSGLMVGLGETKGEVIGVMKDLRKADCDLLTIGQYLQPSPNHHQIVYFVTPEEFGEYETIGLDLGFKAVASGPLVRSSYKAAELYKKVRFLYPLFHG